LSDEEGRQRIIRKETYYYMDDKISKLFRTVHHVIYCKKEEYESI